jgi:hypothetical protein
MRGKREVKRGVKRESLRRESVREEEREYERGKERQREREKKIVRKSYQCINHKDPIMSCHQYLRFISKAKTSTTDDAILFLKQK